MTVIPPPFASDEPAAARTVRPDLWSGAVTPSIRVVTRAEV